jgi:hypothetical protein
MLLQPGGGIHDITNHSYPVWMRLELYERLPGGDGGPDGEYQFRLICVELLNRFLDAKGGTNSSLGIVLVGNRRTEHGEHPVAQQLLDLPSESLDVFPAPAVIGRQASANVFRIRRGGVGGEADQICEQCGDDSPFLTGSERRGGRFGRRLGSPARRAEL